MTFSEAKCLFAVRCPNVCVASPEALEGRCGTSGLPSLEALLTRLTRRLKRQRNEGLTLASKLEKGARREGEPRVGGRVAQEVKAIPCHDSK